MHQPGRYRVNIGAACAILFLLGADCRIPAKDSEKSVSPDKGKTDGNGNLHYWREHLRGVYAESSDVIVIAPFRITTRSLNRVKAVVTIEGSVVKTIKGKKEFSQPVTVECYYEPEEDEKFGVTEINATTPFRIVFFNAAEDVDKNGVIGTDGWSLPRYSKELEAFLRKLK